jgi:hypothetical protein
MNKVVCVDFDGVIHRYRYGWSDGTIYDKPVSGCLSTMEELQDHFDEVVIFSTRAFDKTINGVLQKNQIEEMREWLAYYNVPYSRIATEGKPIADYYIDDNAIRFESWNQTIADIAEHEGFTTKKENSY